MNSSTSSAPVAALRAVRKALGGRLVIDGLTLELHRGTVTALMGPNGAGKTTAARLLLALAAPDAGTVERTPGTTLAAAFQDNRLCPHLTAAANVRLVLGREAGSRATTELAAAGIDATTAEQPVAELSGGQQRRVALARALAPRADLVVLDEPFTGVDAESKPALLEFVRERIGESAVLLITHDANEAAELGARIVRLRKGPGFVM